MHIDDAPRMDLRLAQRLAEKKAELDRYRPLTPTTVRYINEQLRVLLTYHSNAIEGNTLSLRETQLVIEHGMTVCGHSMREHLEATNHAQAFAYLTRLIEQRTPISTSVILTLNGLVVDKLIDQPGQFRNGPVTIRGARAAAVRDAGRRTDARVGCLDWRRGAGVSNCAAGCDRAPGV